MCNDVTSSGPTHLASHCIHLRKRRRCAFRRVKIGNLAPQTRPLLVIDKRRTSSDKRWRVNRRQHFYCNQLKKIPRPRYANPGVAPKSAPATSVDISRLPTAPGRSVGRSVGEGQHARRGQTVDKNLPRNKGFITWFKRDSNQGTDATSAVCRAHARSLLNKY